MRRGVRIAAHDGHPGLGQAELGPDDVDDALRRGADAVERDPELGAVALELVDLGGRLEVQHRQPARRRRDGVIGGRDRLRRPTHAEASLPEPGEGLRGRDLVDEVQVHGEDRGRTVILADDVVGPDLVDDGPGRGLGAGHVAAILRDAGAMSGAAYQRLRPRVAGRPPGSRPLRADGPVRAGTTGGPVVEPGSGTTGAVTSVPHANARQGVRMHPLGSRH